MKVKVIVVEGPDKDREYVFSQPDRFLIGRSRHAHFHLSNEDRYVSRRHCLIEIAPPRCYVHHLSSTNPTFLNDLPIDQAEVQNQDIVKIGKTSLQIHIDTSLEVELQACSGCGKFIFHPDSQGPVLCSNCMDLPRVQPPSNQATSFRCYVCDTDLSAFANKDGRAEELGGKVRYICEACLPAKESLKTSKIGKYELLQRIGVGGMGEVFLAFDPQTHRLAVLKTISEISRRDSLVKHFKREIDIHQRLSHPNIIQYIDSGIHDQRPYLVMEYADGGNMEEWLEKKEGKIPIKDCLAFGLQAMKGLMYFHQLDPIVLHRDIKPSNILLQKVNGRLVPKITDFGLAKAFQQVGGTVLTKMGEKKGTLAFMSVEQYLNARDVDARTDIYAMGATLYYLLTTYLPFQIPSQFQRKMLKQKYPNNPQKRKAALKELGSERNPKDIILGSEIVQIQTRNPDIPVELAQVIHRSLAKGVTDRYPNSKVMYAELERAASQLAR